VEPVRAVARGYIQDRLNNPIHVPKHGTVKAVRLEAPPPSWSAASCKPIAAVPRRTPRRRGGSDITPFTDEQVNRIATTEPTLRDMLQQFRHSSTTSFTGREPGGGGRRQESGDRRQESGIRSQESS